MADRETIIAGDNSGAVIAAVIVLTLVLVGFLIFNGTIRLDGPAPANSVTINVPNPASNVTVTTPAAL